MDRTPGTRNSERKRKREFIRLFLLLDYVYVVRRDDVSWIRVGSFQRNHQ